MSKMTPARTMWWALLWLAILVLAVSSLVLAVHTSLGSWFTVLGTACVIAVCLAHVRSRPRN
ncbi:hypothetical protein [Microbacterium sp. NPDC055683]